MLKQTTNHILMVRPANFGFNEETAANNAFQNNDQSLSTAAIKAKAIEEFDEFVSRLGEKGVNVTVVEDSATPVKPDAIFPNNWISLHQNGTLITYPMYAPTRRNERQAAIIDLIQSKFEVKSTHDFSAYEAKNIFLEGTGSMIFDHPNRLAYACLSERTNEGILDEFCTKMDYTKVVFDAVDANGKAIYHTNVMMAIAETFVVICMDSIRDEAQNKDLRAIFAKTNKAIIDISLEQMNTFAGNMLQVRNEVGATFLVMSEQAYKSLTPTQVALIETHTNILHTPLYTIETYGGGSARCMMAEVFLTAK